MTDRYVPIPIILVYILFWWGAGVLMLIVVTDNSAPTAPQLAIKDAEPKTNTKIEVELERESVDADQGDQISYTYTWFKNGEQIPERSAPVLKTEDYDRGDVLKVSVMPNDGSMDGAMCSLPWRECAGEIVAEIEVEVVNSPPKARIYVEPEEPTRKDDVVLELRGIDNDDDDVTFQVMWFKVGEEPEWFEDEEAEIPEDAEIEYTEANVCTVMDTDDDGEEIEIERPCLPSKATKRGEEWVVRVIPSDADSAGKAMDEVIQIAE